MMILPAGPGAGHKIIVRMASDRDPDALTKTSFAAAKSIDADGHRRLQAGSSIEVVYNVRKLDSATILKLLAALRSVEACTAWK